MNESKMSEVAKSLGGLSSIDRRIFDSVVNAIYEQRLRPGTKLGEQNLAEAFSVSRARIRRVLLTLSQQSVVELIPGRGAFVIRPTADDARDIFSVRRSLERLVVERIIANPDPAIVNSLQKHLRSEAVAESSDHQREAIRMAGEFHIKLVRLSGSRVIGSALEPLLLQCSLLVSMYGGGRASSCSVAEHQAIVDALAVGNTDKARDLMTDHLTLLENSLRLEGEHDEAPDFSMIFRPVI